MVVRLTSWNATAPGGEAKKRDADDISTVFALCHFVAWKLRSVLGTAPERTRSIAARRRLRPPPRGRGITSSPPRRRAAAAPDRWKDLPRRLPGRRRFDASPPSIRPSPPTVPQRRAHRLRDDRRCFAAATADAQGLLRPKCSPFRQGDRDRVAEQNVTTTLVSIDSAP